MTTKEFIEKLNLDAKENNTEIFAKIQAAGQNPEAVYAIAKEVGVSDSFEDFKAEMKAWYESMAQELSEDELAAIAGGASTGEIVCYSVFGTITGGAAIATAVVAVF